MPNRLLSMLLLVLLAGPAMARECLQVVPGGNIELFWQEVQRGAQAAARELDYDLYYRGAKKSSAIEAQQKLVEMVFALRCRAIIIAPGTDYTAFVERARQRHIQVIYMDRTIGDAPDVPLVATDNYAAGRQAARLMQSKVGPAARVVIMRLLPNITSTSDRERGFWDEARALGMQAEYGAYIGDDVGQAKLLAMDYFNQRGLARIDAVFSPNETTATAVILALQKLGAGRRIVHIGFDMSKTILQAIREGSLAGVVVQQPYAMGYQAVVTAHRRLTRQSVPAFHDSGSFMVTPALLSDAATQAMLRENYDLLFSEFRSATLSSGLE